MKKTLFSLAVCALFFAAPKVANSADVSVDFFYNNLSGGSWVEVGDYGYCWQPDVAVSNTSWRPYSDGYWAYTDLGWTWVSYEDFGWATYHYGRWTMLSDYGWVWVPGRDADLEWGPAWVSWRTGGEYIGWAPLPPETIGFVESRPLTGHLDVEFNIGPAYYNFVDIRYIGEPVLRERIIAPTQNITYIQQTVNVTNITYQNKTVYNYGPDVNVINRVAARPVQRLRLEREQNVDVTTAAKSGGLTKVQGDRLVVAAPMRVNRAARQVTPTTIKTKVAAAKIDRGWSAVGDEKAQNEFKQRIRQQNLKSVPPPTGGGAATGQANAAAGASPAAPGAAASPAVGAATASPAAGGAAAQQAGQQGLERERGRRGQRRGAESMAAGSPGATASPAIAASPAEGTAAEARPGRGRGEGRGQGRRGNRFNEPPPAQTAPTGAAASPAEAAAGASPSAAAAGETGATGAAERPGRGQHRGQKEQRIAPGQGASPAATAPEGGATNEQSAPGAGHQGRRGQLDQNNPEGQAGPGQGRQGRRFEGQPAETAPGDLSAQPGGGRRHEHAQGAAGPAGERQQGQGEGEGRHRGKQQGQGEAATPSPTP